MTVTADGLSIHAVQEHPIVILPSVSQGKPAGEAIVRVEVTLPEPGPLRIFWLTTGNTGYDENHVSTQEIAGGRRFVYFRIPMEKFMDPLRLDIGQTPGDFKLHSIEVRAVR
jgi:hypothetical protein